MPRPIEHQVVVITGAASGIGRETALHFAQKGAAVVVADQNSLGLQTLMKEIERLGGGAHAVTVDVAEWQQLEGLAQQAVERFGRIDTWVNDASVSVYATVEQLTPEEIERVVRVNLLGVIHGSRAALRRMKPQRDGTIINVGSALSWRAVPLQSIYCATKAGIKSFTDALRLELEHEKAGITVTLIGPSSINTPFFNSARSKLGVKPMPVPPVYEPGIVAQAILHAAEHPARDIVVGGWGKLLTVMERLAPRLLDTYMLFRGQMFRKQKTDQPDDGRDALFEPIREPGRTTGDFGAQSKSTSPYTTLIEEHPARRRLILTALLFGLAALIRHPGR